MRKKNQRIVEGSRDILFGECKVMENLSSQFNDLFNSWGYDEVLTPSLEFYSVFSKYPYSINENNIYKFFDSKGRSVALKADNTMAIGRVVSTKLEDKSLPIRIRYASPVFRVNDGLKEKRNEFIDCGIEFIGEDQSNADLEIIAIAINALRLTKIKDVRLEIGHVDIFNSIFDSLNLEEPYREILGELVSKRKMDELKAFLDRINIDYDKRETIEKLPEMYGDKEMLSKARTIIKSEMAIKAIDYLSNIYDAFVKIGYDKYIVFNLSSVPKINYYSGIIFKGFAGNNKSHVIKGGRYDKLLKAYGRDLKAAGLSINLNKLEEIIYKTDYNASEDVYRVCYKENDMNDYIEKLEISERIRKQGNRVELCKEKCDIKEKEYLQKEDITV